MHQKVVSPVHFKRKNVVSGARFCLNFKLYQYVVGRKFAHNFPEQFKCFCCMNIGYLICTFDLPTFLQLFDFVFSKFLVVLASNCIRYPFFSNKKLFIKRFHQPSVDLNRMKWNCLFGIPPSLHGQSCWLLLLLIMRQ